MTMDTSFSLLRSLVETDEAALDHWNTCPPCRDQPGACDAGRALMKETVLAQLRAKVYVDRVKKLKTLTPRPEKYPLRRITDKVTV